MIKVVFSCHVEHERRSYDLGYLSWFLQIVKKTGLPIILTFMVGDKLGPKLLEYVSKHSSEIPDRCPIGLHIHDSGIKKAFGYYQKYFLMTPKIISFGHWTATPERIKSALKYGATLDLSYTALHRKDKYIFKPPFKYAGINEIPVTCDPRPPYYPINPLNSHYHFLLTLFLFVIFLPTNKLLHVYFHSFDLIEKKSALWKLHVLSVLFKGHEAVLHEDGGIISL